MTVAPEDGSVTIRNAQATLKSRTKYSEFSLIKRATNEWIIAGDLAAS